MKIGYFQQQNTYFMICGLLREIYILPTGDNLLQQTTELYANIVFENTDRI